MDVNLALGARNASARRTHARPERANPTSMSLYRTLTLKVSRNKRHVITDNTLADISHEGGFKSYVKSDATRRERAGAGEGSSRAHAKGKTMRGRCSGGDRGRVSGDFAFPTSRSEPLPLHRSSFLLLLPAPSLFLSYSFPFFFNSAQSSPRTRDAR